MITSIVLFDRNFDLACTIEADDLIDPEHGLFTIAADHVAARWLVQHTDGRGSVYAVARGEGGGWRGPLRAFTIHQRGQCHECSHCQRHVLTADWAVEAKVI